MLPRTSGQPKLPQISFKNPFDPGSGVIVVTASLPLPHHCREPYGGSQIPELGMTAL